MTFIASDFENVKLQNFFDCEIKRLKLHHSNVLKLKEILRFNIRFIDLYRKDSRVVTEYIKLPFQNGSPLVNVFRNYVKHFTHAVRHKNRHTKPRHTLKV